MWFQSGTTLNKKEVLIIDNELSIVNNKNITNYIYTIRDKQVILDSDVAMLYNCETRIVNQAMKRNINRFPERFCFQLSKEELENLKSQIVISSFEGESGYGGRRTLPYAFTEQGISMLAPLLKSEIAVQVSIKIMDAFVEMRKFITVNKDLFERITIIENKIDNKFIDYDKKFEQIFNKLQRDENFKQKIFFEGQIYDAYSLIIDIIKIAKHKITIIDNYIDDSILKMLTKKNENVEVVILTSEKSNISKLDIQKFNKEYPILKIGKSDKFHDRFILIDNKELYHLRSIHKGFREEMFWN